MCSGLWALSEWSSPLHVPKPVLTCSRHLIKRKQNYIKITIPFLSCTSWISGAQWPHLASGHQLHSAAQTMPTADSSAGQGWPGTGSLHAAAAHDARLGLEGDREGSPPSAGPIETSLKPMNCGMLFSTEPVIPCPTLSCYALLTGLRQGLGLAQGHTAGGGCKGLRSPDSALAAPQHPAAQTGQSAVSMPGGGAGLQKGFFFADEQKPKKLPWSDGGGQLATAAEWAPINPRDGSPVTTGMTIRLGKGQEQGSSPCPLSAGSGGTSVTTPAAISKQYSLLCSWGLGPQVLADSECGPRQVTSRISVFSFGERR